MHAHTHAHTQQQQPQCYTSKLANNTCLLLKLNQGREKKSIIVFGVCVLQKPDALTTGTGAPVGNKLASLTVGPRGPILLQDFVFTDEMAHFNRERIPERVVHAKGSGC